MGENQIINKIDNEIQLLKNQLIEKNNLIEKLQVALKQQQLTQQQLQLQQVPETSDDENSYDSDNSIGKFSLNKKKNNNSNDFPMALYTKIVKTLNVGDKYNEFIKFMVLKSMEEDYIGNDNKPMMTIIPSPQIQLLWKEMYLKSKLYNQLCNLLGVEGVVNSIQYDQDELDRLNRMNSHGEDYDSDVEIALNSEKQKEYRLKYLNTIILYKQYFAKNSNEIDQIDEILESNELNRHWPITFLMNKQEKYQLKIILKNKRNNNEKVNNNKRIERDEDNNEDQHPNLKKQESSNYIKIIVKTLNFKDIPMCVNVYENIENLKYKLYVKEGIPYDQMILKFMGETLENENTLSYYQITQESTLWIVLNLRGC